MKVTAFWDVTSYTLVCRYLCVFEEPAAFGSALKLEAVSSSLTFTSNYQTTRRHIPESTELVLRT
jgi:hypothetical protein